MNSIITVCKSFKIFIEHPNASFKSDISFRAFAERITGAIIPSKKFGS
jgi:hypothetical protein